VLALEVDDVVDLIARAERHCILSFGAGAHAPPSYQSRFEYPAEQRPPMTLRRKIDSAIVPDMYSVGHHPDPLIFDAWHDQRRYVKFIAQDVWPFVPKLYEHVPDKEFQPSPS
jgi:hypothetical protein